MMKYIQHILCLVGITSYTIASLSQQGIYLDNAAIYNQANTLIYIQGDVEISNLGTIENLGDIDVTRNWINNAGNTGLINNRTGSVNLIGGNQFIGGNSTTYFYDLNLFGGLSLKEVFQDVLVTNTLDINDAELQVHQNTFLVSNPDPMSVYWNAGFVSGDSIGGYFSRSTDRTSVYRYPVGNSSLFTSNYRGIDITPATGDSNIYGVRLAAIDASLDNTGTSFTGANGPYNRTLKYPSIVEINPVFYHHIARQYGVTPATVKMYFFENDHLSQDKRFEGIAQWNKTTPRWDFVDANLTANISGPNDIGSPQHFLTWGETDFNDDIFALDVLQGLLIFIPQIFSPNGDGANDILYVRGRRIKEVKFIIYNRWGEKVFETEDKNIGWDGTFNGTKAQSSVYVYYVDAEIEDYGRIQQKGNITLVR